MDKKIINLQGLLRYMDKKIINLQGLLRYMDKKIINLQGCNHLSVAFNMFYVTPSNILDA